MRLSEGLEFLISQMVIHGAGVLSVIPPGGKGKNDILSYLPSARDESPAPISSGPRTIKLPSGDVMVLSVRKKRRMSR